MHTYIFIKLKFFSFILNLEFLNLEQYFLCPGYKESRLYFLLVLEQLYFLFKSMYVCIYILNQFGGYSDIGCEV